jgi:endoglucanase
VASPSGGQLQIKNSGGTVLATVTIPNTGGYQNWQTVTANIALAAGTQTVRIFSTSNGWNFNWWEVAGASTTPTPPPASGTTSRIEAENFSAMSGVQKETTTDAGGGQNVSYIDNTDWMDYSVNVSAAGTYAVNLRVSSPTGGQLQIRNSAGTVLGSVTVPNTGGWQNWQTVTTNVTLSAGQQTIRVYSAFNGWNFNWWEMSGSAGTVTTKAVGEVSVESISPLDIYPNPITDRFQLNVNNELTGTVSVQVFDAQGAVQKQFSLSKTDAGTAQFYLSIGQLAAGTYTIKVTMNDWTESKQIVKQ